MEATNVAEGWNGVYLLTDQMTEGGSPVYKLKNEEKYLYFDDNKDLQGQGFYKFDVNIQGTVYVAMVETGTVDGFPASDVWFINEGQYRDGTIDVVDCPGIIFFFIFKVVKQKSLRFAKNK